MKKQKMTREIVPQDFTLRLALVDAVPVLFFGASMILAGILLKNIVFLIGAALCLFAGAAKVLWKIIVVLQKKNIWWMFLQMRILMPLGFVLMVISAIVSRNAFASAFAGAIALPSVLFFGLGILGMVLMLVFAFTLDSADAKANWIEQLTNGAAQICFFLGLLFLF